MVMDYPVEEMMEQASKLVDSNPAHVRVYQKFTCSNCKERIAAAEPNTFYRNMKCCLCGHEQVIEKCGYMAHFSREPFQ